MVHPALCPGAPWSLRNLSQQTGVLQAWRQDRQHQYCQKKCRFLPPPGPLGQKRLAFRNIRNGGSKARESVQWGLWVSKPAFTAGMCLATWSHRIHWGSEVPCGATGEEAGGSLGCTRICLGTHACTSARTHVGCRNVLPSTPELKGSSC